jgi:hypothetical protein
MTSPGGSFREQLELVVKATTGEGEAGFARLTTAATTADRAAKDTGESVARAAQRVAEARDKEADAAGKVRIAEQRLRDLRDKGITDGARYVTAQEQLETAQRRQHTASRELESATEAQAQAQRKAATAVDETTEAAERQGRGLDDLKGKFAAFAGGVAIGDWARDTVGGFVDGARASQAMATSMNATVEQAGAFLTLVGSVGLEMDDLIEIQAEFATKTKDGLTLVGTELQHNADGTVNWTETLVDTLSTLQGVTDATERNRLGFSMFGEEGYKQLSRLLNSGVDVREALEQIGTPFTEDDVELARQYDAQMLELSRISGEFGRTLGRLVIPVVTGLVDAGQDLASVLDAIPAPVAVAGAAAVLFGVGMRRASIDGTLLAGALGRVTAAAATFRGVAALTSVSAATMGAAMGGAAAAGRGLLTALGGPIGLAMLGVGAGVAVVSSAVDTFEGDARRMAVEANRAEQEFGDMAVTTRELGQQMVEDAGVTDRWVASIRGADEALAAVGDEATAVDDASGGMISSLLGSADALFDLGLAEAGATAEIERQREAMGEAAVEADVAREATKSLKDMIAEGTTSGSEFAGAVRDAAEAEAAQTRTTDLAAAAIEAYNAVTRDAVATQLEMFEAQLASRDGWIGVQQSVHNLAGTVDDLSTPWNEVQEAQNQALESILSYGGAAADAAVETQEAQGVVMDSITEAGIRAEATLEAMRASLNAPGLTDAARAELEQMIGKLEEAQQSGDIDAILRLTGVEETEGQLDETTEDRETHVQVESRGGPAVDRYLDGLAEAARLSIIRVESRNGPAVRAYLQTLVDAQRLAIIRVESRGGPAVNAYLDSLANEDRLAIIRVETRGGPAVRQYLDDLAGAARVAGISVGGGLRGGPGAGTYGAGRLAVNAEIDLQLTGRIDRGQLSAAERGRATIRDVKAYEQRNGTGWRRS